MYVYNVHRVQLGFALQNQLYIRSMIVPNYWLWNNFEKFSKVNYVLLMFDF